MNLRLSNRRPRRSSGHPRGVHDLLGLMIALLLLGCVAHAADPPDGWRTAAREAVELLRRDDAEAAQSLAANLSHSAPDARTRAEASAVLALTQLASTERSTVNDARYALSRLEEQLPGLLDRPDCELALGLAAIPLGETFSALRLLSAAADDFLAIGQKPRASTALVGLASAWATHGEWEITGPPFVTQRPRTPAQQYALRLEKISEVAQRLVAMDAPVDARDAVDYELARLSPPKDAAAPIDSASRLQALASAAPRSVASCRAALELAVAAQREGDHAAATSLFESAAKSTDAAIATAARTSLAALAETSAALAIEVDSASRTATIVPTWRNAKSAALEVIAVDPKGWLNDRLARFNPYLAAEKHGRMVERKSFMPGLDAAATQPVHAIRVSAEPGKLLIVRLIAFNHRQLPTYAHHVVSLDPLHAEVVLRREKAAVWAIDSRTGQPAANATYSFWMAGSYVAASGAMVDGATCFSLPAESKLTSDPRWLALVEAQGMVSLVFGRCSDDAQSCDLEVELLTPVGNPRAGEPIAVAGLLTRFDRPALDVAADALRLELRDATGRVAAATGVSIRNGLLEGTFTVDDAWAADVLRVVLLYDKHVVPQRGASATVTPAIRRLPLRVTIDAPPVMPKGAELLTYRIEATYPWGTRVAQGSAEEALRLTLLPTDSEPQLRDIRKAAHSRRYSGWTDRQAGFALPELRSLSSPAALLLRVAISDGGTAGGLTEHAILSEDRLFAWLRPSATSLHAFDWLHFDAGWVAPRPLPTCPGGVVEVAPRTDPRRLVGSGLFRSGFGWRSIDHHWFDESAGMHDAKLSLCVGPTIHEVRTSIELLPAEPDSENRRIFELGADAFIDDLVSGCRIFPFGKPKLAVALGPEPLLAEWVPPLRPFEGFDIQPPAKPTAVALFTAAASPHDSMRAGCAAIAEHHEHLSATAALDESGELKLRFDAPPTDEPLPVLFQIYDNETDPTDLWREVREEPDQRTVDLAGFASKPVLQTLDAPIEARPPLTCKDKRPRIGGVHDGRPPLAFSLFTLRPGQSELSVPPPLSGRPTHFDLFAVSRQGCVLRSHGALYEKRGLSVRLDAPAVATLGDRIELTAQLSNESDQPIDASIEWIESARQPDATDSSGRMAFAHRAVASQASSTGLEIRVPPNTTQFVSARFEAAAVGQARTGLRVRDSTGLTRKLATPTHIIAPLAPPPDAPISIRRSISRLIIDDPAHRAAPSPNEPRESEPGRKPTFNTIPLGVDEAVESGTLILVREEIRVARTLRGLRWRQPMPATGVFRPLSEDAPRGVAQIVQIDDGLPAGFSGRADAVAAGQYVQEYCIQAGRPGIAEFVAPAVQSGAESLPVAVEPRQLRLNVTR